MKRTMVVQLRHALTVACLLLATANSYAQDLLQFGAGGDTERVVEIDFTAMTHDQRIKVVLSIINADSDGNGRQLVAFSNAPFPIRIEHIDGYEPDWYEFVATPGSEVGLDGLVLAHNIFPNPSGACEGEDLPPCEYTLTVEFTLGVLGEGVLARAGAYEITFMLTENENPITIDFTEFFKSLEVEAP